MEQETKRVVVNATGLGKHFLMGNTTVYALQGVDLTVEQGELVAILGPSGSGKSTLLGLLGGLDTPSSGRVEIGGVDITHMSENRLADIRNRRIGFVFQFSRNGRYSPRRRAEELLSLVGLSDRLKHRPGQLSGGEQQRVAIARALANAPDLILADEPTGNLDTTTGQAVLQALLDVRRETGTTLIIVTHDTQVAALADRVLTMQDGAFVP